ncbi:hypothetical protein HQ489_00345 [Candidatus Woesearchaeota archaeon]|nr:hypothetical protein [Candidatus Woesearchaeota archaeon]
MGSIKINHSKQEMQASLQKDMVKILESLYGCLTIFKKKYKTRDETKYIELIEIQQKYVENFMNAFLSVIALTKELEVLPKLHLEKDSLELAEANAGHIYQQLHDEMLPILKSEIKDKDPMFRNKLKKWEQKFWANLELSMRGFQKELAVVADKAKRNLSKKQIQSARQILPRFSFANILSIPYGFRRALSLSMTTIMIAISAGCSDDPTPNEPPPHSQGETSTELIETPTLIKLDGLTKYLGDLKIKNISGFLFTVNSSNQGVSKRLGWRHNDKIIFGEENWVQKLEENVTNGDYGLIIITGHHTSNIDYIYGNSGEKFRLEDLPYSDKIEVVMFSACRTAGTADYVSRNVYAPLIRRFPNLKVIMGFEVASLKEEGITTAILTGFQEKKFRPLLKEENGPEKFATNVIEINRNRGYGVAFIGKDQNWNYISSFDQKIKPLSLINNSLQ